MRIFYTAAAILVFLFAFVTGSCIEAPEVVQGTVVSFDAAASLVTIRDECPPNREIALSVETAEIGAEPEPGDVVRAAFRIEGGRNEALRIMNLTRQKEIGLASAASSSDRCSPPKE